MMVKMAWWVVKGIDYHEEAGDVHDDGVVSRRGK
jgi:hypothetical protein